MSIPNIKEYIPSSYFLSLRYRILSKYYLRTVSIDVLSTTDNQPKNTRIFQNSNSITMQTSTVCRRNTHYLLRPTTEVNCSLDHFNFDYLFVSFHIQKVLLCAYNRSSIVGLSPFAHHLPELLCGCARSGDMRKNLLRKAGEFGNHLRWVGLI